MREGFAVVSWGQRPKGVRSRWGERSPAWLLKILFPVALLVLGGLSLPHPARAAWDPPGWKQPDPAPPADTSNPAALVLGWALKGYRATVSRVDGNRCPSYPTCSAYALEAVMRYGPVLGAALTANRLVGEADEAAFAPRIWVGGQWKVYSPVEDDLAFLRGSLAP